MLVNFYKSLVISIFVVILMPSAFALADEQKLFNAGFVSHNIWYSKPIFFSGDNVIIHTVIKSGGEYDFSGTVKFYDKGVNLGSKDFFIKSGVFVGDVGIKWNATAGEHNIGAKIVNAKIIIDGNKVDIVVSNNEASGIKSFIDTDTDGDGIGNREDLDDDGDGISDKDELKAGTDPLKKNTATGNTISKTSDVSKDDPNKVSSSNNILQKTGGITKNKILPVVSNVAKKIFNVTEMTRHAQKEFADKKIIKVKKSIVKEKENKTKKGDKKNFNTRTPFNYIILFTLIFLKYSAKYMFVYYILLLIAVVYFLRRLIRWFV